MCSWGGANKSTRRTKNYEKKVPKKRKTDEICIVGNSEISEGCFVLTRTYACVRSNETSCVVTHETSGF